MKNKTNNPKVTIVVATYNNKDIIGDTLKAIRALNYVNYDIFVVDDASRDGTSEYVRLKYPWVKVISKKNNSGPSVSRNIAINASKGKYVTFLDSDVVLDKNWLSECVSILEQDNQTGICGSKLLDAYNPNILNEAGGTLLKMGIGLDRGAGESATKYNRKERLFYIGSAAIVIRRSVLEKIGFFDESYFFGYQDVDLCWRTNLIGYKVVYNPKAIAYHKYHTTVKKMGCMVAHHNLRNSIKTMIKNYGTTNLLINLPLALLVSICNIVVLRDCRRAQISALMWNLINIKETLKARKMVQRMRTVKDSEISRLMMTNRYLINMINNRIKKYWSNHHDNN